MSHSSSQIEFLDSYRQTIKQKTISCFEKFKLAKENGKDTSRDIEISLTEKPWNRIAKLLRQPELATKIQKLFIEKKNPFEIVLIFIDDMIKDHRPDEDQEEFISNIMFSAVSILTKGKLLPNELISYVGIHRGKDDSWLELHLNSSTASQVDTHVLVSLLIVAHRVRSFLHLGLFRFPSREILFRYLEEINLYASANNITINEKIISELIPKLGIEVTSDFIFFLPVTQHQNISIHGRNLANFVRGGMCEVYLSILKQQKEIKQLDEKHGLSIDWITFSDDNIISITEKSFFEKSRGIKPQFAHSSTKYNFRLRYGRARNTGGNVVGIHPTTMALLGITTGTQLFLDNGMDECIVSPVTSIEPPLVKYRNGEIKRLKNYEKSLARIDFTIEEVIQLGDILIDPYSLKEDIIKCGFTEDHWSSLAKLNLQKNAKSIIEKDQITNKLKLMIENHQTQFPTLKNAMIISDILKIPLHPKYVPEYSNLSISEFEKLYDWLKSNYNFENYNEMILGKFSSEEIVSILEKLFIPLRIEKSERNIISSLAKLLEKTFFLDSEQNFIIDRNLSIMENINSQSCYEHKRKYPLSGMIAASCGRVESARIKKINPIAHFLFPLKGNILKSPKIGKIKDIKSSVELESFNCKKCSEKSFKPYCFNCNIKIINLEQKTDVFEVNFSEEFTNAMTRSKVNVDRLRGVSTLKSKRKHSENFIKGVLRSYYGLNVYRDGSSRVSATNMILTHFKPSEINTSIEELKKLGYLLDFEGNKLESNEQLIELRENDIIINRTIAEYLLKVSQFVDNELKSLYNSKRYYRCKNIDDLKGNLIISTSKKNSFGIIGRIIGFCDAKVCYANPLWHSSKNTGVDGSEDSIILFGDALLNCSTKHLSPTPGTLLDFPLFVSINVDYFDIIPELKNIMNMKNLPLLFFSLLETTHQDSLQAIDTIESTYWCKTSELAYQNIGFNQKVTNVDMISHANIVSGSKSKLDRIKKQLNLAKNLRGLSYDLIAEKTLAIILNEETQKSLSQYLNQTFSCNKCQKKYERPPIAGKCLQCNSETIVMTNNPEKRLNEFFNNFNNIKNTSDVSKEIFDYLISQRNSIFGKKSFKEFKQQK